MQYTGQSIDGVDYTAGQFTGPKTDHPRDGMVPVIAIRTSVLAMVHRSYALACVAVGLTQVWAHATVVTGERTCVGGAVGLRSTSGEPGWRL